MEEFHKNIGSGGYFTFVLFNSSSLGNTNFEIRHSYDVRQALLYFVFEFLYGDRSSSNMQIFYSNFTE
jgi:hypothetical protein